MNDPINKAKKSSALNTMLGFIVIVLGLFFLIEGSNNEDLAFFFGIAVLLGAVLFFFSVCTWIINFTRSQVLSKLEKHSNQETTKE